MDKNKTRLAGIWLYYGFYRMLVITLGGALQMPAAPGHRFGPF
jgi:hypothetical protein